MFKNFNENIKKKKLKRMTNKVAKKLHFQNLHITWYKNW